VVDPPVNPPDDPPVVNPPVEPPSVKPPNDPPDDSPVVAPPEEPPVLAPPDDPPVVEPPEKPPVVEPPVVEPVEVPVDSSTAAATGVVWVDDGDGIRPAANPSAGSAGEREPRLAGVTVRLLGPEGDSLVETRTDTRGRYEFVALPAGQYRVEFEAPPGYQFTVASAGGDATRDSDVVSTEVREKPGVAPLILGTTILSDLAVDQSLTWDAGLLPIPTDDSTPEPPPAEDPDELATEPPEPTAGREEPPPVDPPTGDGDESNGRVESGAGRGG